MRCQFCKQDVDSPCHDSQEMQQRASNHITRCENALKSTRHGIGGGARPKDVQGSH
jgi:hypothetical protein